MSERFLRASDVARILNVRTSTVYALCRRGELVHVRLGEGRQRPLIRFQREQIDAFLRERTFGPAKGSEGCRRAASVSTDNGRT